MTLDEVLEALKIELEATQNELLEAEARALELRRKRERIRAMISAHDGTHGEPTPPKGQRIQGKPRERVSGRGLTEADVRAALVAVKSDGKERSREALYGAVLSCAKASTGKKGQGFSILFERLCAEAATEGVPRSVAST